jgi:hypothetical protein
MFGKVVSVAVVEAKEVFTVETNAIVIAVRVNVSFFIVVLFLMSVI